MEYEELAAVYEQLESTAKRLEKTWYVSKLLEKTKEEDIGRMLLLLQGKLFPIHDQRKIGVAAKLVQKAIVLASGLSATRIGSLWKMNGDLGEAAKAATLSKRQATLFSHPLTVKKVFENLSSLATIDGPGSVGRKTKIIAELLTSSRPVEAKYIVRTVLEDLRIGIGEGVLRDAIVWAFFPKVIGVFYYHLPLKCYAPPITLKSGKVDTKSEPVTDGFRVQEIEDVSKIKMGCDLVRAKNPRSFYNALVQMVQDALDVTNDFGKVALLAKKGDLCHVKMAVLTPIKVMLYQKAKGFEDAFERVGTPAAIEYKYDGFRVNIHKAKGDVRLFTRRLEDVTNQFPDIMAEVKQCIGGKDFIIDGEVIGIDSKTGKWLPFQRISQRIKRKYDIRDAIARTPVIVNLFDIMEYDGEDCLKMPFRERRALLEKITKESKRLMLARQLVSSDIAEAKEFYDNALALGNEGVMVKSLDAPYKPGSRVGSGVKIKPTMDTLDLVIIGAEWGEGKRSRWLSSFIVACRDDQSDRLLEIGRVSTGLKEKPEGGVSFEQLTALLTPIVTAEKGRMVTVKPKIVLEVDYEEIQKSPSYSSGYALRFPRIVGLRVDKPVFEISSLASVENLFLSQN
jgi:DNA ligase 1